MSVVADLTIPTTQFALRDSLAAAPNVDVEFERMVTHSQEWIMPFLWVSGGDLDRFEEEVADDSTVIDATITDEFELAEDDRIVLYQIHWNDEIKRIVNTIFDQEGTLLEAIGQQNRWELKVRFEAEAALSALQTHFEEADIPFTVVRVYTPSEPRQPAYNVSSAQREALVEAFDDGYFSVPRQATASEIAEKLDISPNALSERLRRGTANLIRTTLTV